MRSYEKISSHNDKKWEEQRSDHDMTWEAREEYTSELDRAIAMFQDLKDVRSVVTPEDWSPAIEALEAIDMGVVAYEGRTARIVVQPSRAISRKTGYPMYDLDVHAIELNADLSAGVPYLQPDSLTHIDSWSLNTGMPPLKTTLQNVQEFNSYLDQVAAQAGVA